MKEDINFANVDWKILNDYLPEKLLEELDEEHDTNIHQRLSVTSRQTYGDLASESRATYSDPLQNQHHSDQISTNSIHQLDLESLSNDRYLLESFIQPINNFDWNSECHRTNMRNEIIKRFLTAMSVDYEKQWCLGMIRQRTLKILIETIEEAKAKLSLKRHWQLLTKRFSFHSAKSHLENMLTKFPEFANIDNDVMNSVLNEARMLQVRASLVLHDLQHSYKKCWAIEMTKRCAQMLLKHESVAIVQLYETGMLNENEYAHILKLIQKKLFHLEYSHLMGIPKIHLNREQDNPFNYLSLFADLTENEKAHFKELLETRHRWFQPGEVLLRQGYITSEAYLIIRGIVECSEDLLTCYRAGHIIGIDALFDKTSSASNRTYRAESSIVEAYTIDESILNMFLSNVKMTRLIYNEIALHMLINMYQEPVNLLNYAQIKVLLDEYAIFYQNEIDHDIMTIQLRRNERLFLLIGTIQREDDDYFIDGPQLVTVN
ncbi:unnamed protein product, partial [Rotaria sp. Silwood1]